MMNGIVERTPISVLIGMLMRLFLIQVVQIILNTILMMIMS